MGVKFERAKITTKKLSTGLLVSDVQTYSDSINIPLLPLIGITRTTNEGRAQKVSVPYSTTVNDMVSYSTIWQPIGQEGWIVKIQTTLKYVSTDHDEIDNWQSVNTGQLLLVSSNQTDAEGIEDSTCKEYKRLPLQSLWYVDKITIASRKGVAEIADMELTLVRCWI